MIKKVSIITIIAVVVASLAVVAIARYHNERFTLRSRVVSR